MKRSILGISLSFIVYGLSVGVPAVQAQPFPNRPIQFVIPMVPGAAGDITGRLLAEELGKILAVQVVVLNKPGASMTLGTDFVAKSKKDGYTLTYTNTSAIVYSRVTNSEPIPYDPNKDLDPLGLHLFFPLTVTVQESSPWKTFAELIDYARKNPGKIRVSTPGQESIDHFNVEVVQSLTGAQFTHVPFKGGQAVVTALLGGHVEVTFTALPSQILPHVEAGKLRVLLLSKKRLEFPNIPTLIELGYKQDMFSAWFALYAPAGVPEEVKKVMVPAIEKAAKNPEVKAKLEKMGYVVDYKSPAELKRIMMEDYERAMSIAERIGLRK